MRQEKISAILFCCFAFFATLLQAQPAINSIIPTSASPGTTVTIAGSGFDGTLANNHVFFGAVKAQVNTASTTQLTVTVPTGAIFSPVTVKTPTGIGYSPQAFLPTFPAGSVNFNNRSFATAVNTTTGTSPISVAICDFDGDGKADMAAVNNSSGTAAGFSVLRNTSTNGIISFAAKTDFATANFPFGIATGDVNGDAKPDVVISTSTAGISVFINTSSVGSISFATAITFTAGTTPRGIDINDIDGDGKPDIAFTNFNSNNFSVLRNTTIGATLSFATKVDFATGNGPNYISLRDMDGDNKPDAAVTCQTPNYVSVLRNTSTPGTISFATKQDFGTGTLPNGIACGDIDGDGKADLATSNFGTSNISVLRNTSAVGAISFATKVDFPLAPLAQPDHIAMGDLNGDGKPDLVVPDKYSGGNMVNVFRNTSVSGSITMAARASYTTGNGPKYSAIGDLDGDGKADLAVVCGTINAVSVFRNIPPPVVSSFTPATGAAGSTVTISGFNFRVNPAENIVFFGGMKATVTAASNTSLSVTVPSGSTHLPVSVTTEALTGHAKLPFIATFSGGDSIIANSYAARQIFSSGNNGYDATIADFDGDGKNDVAIHTYSNSSNSVYRNTSTPGSVSFAAPITITNFSSQTSAIIAADLNGDGKLDLISAGGTSNSINIYRNTSVAGTISFVEVTTNLGVSNEATNVYVADLNNDGRPEIIVDTKGYVVVIPNTSTTSTLSFGANQLYAIADYRDKIAVADFDGDGKVDIVSGQSFMKNTSEFGVISFGTLTNFAPTALHNYFVTADFNTDGKPDIAELYSDSGRLRLYANTSTLGNISFALQPSTYITGTYPVRMSAGDLNGDGKPDISVANQDYDAISLFANTSVGSTISFANKVDQAAGHWPWAAAIGDLDGDSKPDLVVPNWQDQSFSVFRYSPDVLPASLPEVLSFLPESGMVNDTITITGKNFSNTPADNKVNFGGVLAKVISATNTSLQVKVPAGAANKLLTVTNATGLTGYSKKHFKIIFGGAGQVFTPTSFDTAKLFAAIDEPAGLCFGDIDGDGKNDVAVANSSGASVSVFRNTSIVGFVNFATRVDIPAGNTPKSCAIADLNGDGKPELLVANSESNNVMVYRNTSTLGSISFDAPVSFGTDQSGFGHPLSIEVQDLDGDGKPDIAMSNKNIQSITILRNTSATIGGVISMSKSLHFTGGNRSNTISIKDMDGNGKPDIVFGNDGNQMFIMSNTSVVGEIAFTRGSFYSPNSINGVTGIETPDLNDDGKPDIAIATSSNGFSRLQNKSFRGTHRMEPTVNFGPNIFSKGMSADDFDGDGRTDIAIINLFNRSVSITKNNYNNVDTPYFKTAVEYSVTPGTNTPTAIVTADIDGDGKADIVTTSIASNYLSVLLNKTGAPLKLCPNGGVTLNAEITGTSFQWQVSTDNGVSFSNLTNNGNYQGTNSSSLLAGNLPSSWTGYQYKCISNTSTSVVFTIRFYNTWTGVINNAWENPGNWSCGIVPDLFTDVVVGAGANIVLNSNTSIATISVNPDATLTVGAGITLTLVGH